MHVLGCFLGNGPLSFYPELFQFVDVNKTGWYSVLFITISYFQNCHNSQCEYQTLSMTSKPLQKKQSDDIDNLLDQVEKKYFSAEAKKISEIAPKDCECTKKQETNWEEVDEILKDFVFEDTNPFGKHKNNSWVRSDIPQASEASSKSSKGKKVEETYLKCFSVLLAGSYESMGHSELGRERPCDNLKCLRCDFQVLSFDNYSWDPSTDYLFLRNNMPEFQKLAVKLQKKKGYRAYACQCQHLSINKITFIGAKPEVKWICGRHKVT